MGHLGNDALAAAVVVALALAGRGGGGGGGGLRRPHAGRTSRDLTGGAWGGGGAARTGAGGGGAGARAARPARPRRVGSRPSRRDAWSVGPADGDSARWARPADLGALLVGAPDPGRLVLGRLAGAGRLSRRPIVAAEASQSVAVVGPTQSGKTSALAIPAILRWEGPVLAASVKTDLVRDTLAQRRSFGRVWCFDPSGATGLPASRWSPLATARTWAGARRVASDMTEVARGGGTTADGEFWYATAAKLLSPLLLAAAVTGRTMRDVIRWVDTQEVAEVAEALEGASAVEALQAARATWARDDRQRSSVYTTAETVLEPYAEPSPEPQGAHATPPTGGPADAGARASGGVPGDAPSWPGPGAPDDVDPQALLLGRNTLYLCAPAHDQRRLRGLFSAVAKQVVEAAFARSARLGRPLDPPLLVVLDEAANITPLAELDGLAATCAGHGVQLVTIWQDLAQVRARYGERAATVLNNHRAKLFLPGTADPGTLDHASRLVGDERLMARSVTRGGGGDWTVTTSPSHRPLLPPDALRQQPPGTAVLVYGSLPPVRLRLLPWYAGRSSAVGAPKSDTGGPPESAGRSPAPTSDTGGPPESAGRSPVPSREGVGVRRHGWFRRMHGLVRRRPRLQSM